MDWNPKIIRLNPNQLKHNVYYLNKWRFGSYHIGTTKVIMIGPVRIFVHEEKS